MDKTLSAIFLEIQLKILLVKEGWNEGVMENVYDKQCII